MLLHLALVVKESGHYGREDVRREGWCVGGRCGVREDGYCVDGFFDHELVYLGGAVDEEAVGKGLRV